MNDGTKFSTYPYRVWVDGSSSKHLTMDMSSNKQTSSLLFITTMVSILDASDNTLGCYGLLDTIREQKMDLCDKSVHIDPEKVTILSLVNKHHNSHIRFPVSFIVDIEMLVCHIKIIQLGKYPRHITLPLYSCWSVWSVKYSVYTGLVCLIHLILLMVIMLWYTLNLQERQLVGAWLSPLKCCLVCQGSLPPMIDILRTKYWLSRFSCEIH